MPGDEEGTKLPSKESIFPTSQEPTPSTSQRITPEIYQEPATPSTSHEEGPSTAEVIQPAVFAGKVSFNVIE